MSKPQAVHLHVHSEYSLLDGANKIPELVQRCADLGMSALGLTDHGVLNGAVELYKECKKRGVKPILGLEAYFVDDHRQTARKFERNHLTLLAGSTRGFGNLVKLSSAGFLEGFRRNKPNVDLELLDRYSDGLICLSGCLQARFARRIAEDRRDDARKHADDLMRIFGSDNFYIELQNNGLRAQDKVNEGAVKIAAEIGRPLVGTADVHYLRREDYKHHAALLCVQTKSTLDAPKISFETNEFYLKSPQEMVASFERWPQAIPTTLEIAERCEVEFELGRLLLPEYPCPDGKRPDQYLRERVERGAIERYGEPVPAKARERLEYELGVIADMGFESYFLIVWDFVKYAKDNGIAVGPGRGSAAGSVVAYCLKITDVDPLEYDLLFERFLNPARKSMPDIDIDFSTEGRDRVIRYVGEKYGSRSVAQIITFGKMAPKAATRDAGRVLGRAYSEVDRIAKLIPDPIMGRNPSFEGILREGEPLRQAYDSEPSTKEVVDLARGLEGIVRNNSIHAAAVVIADRPLTEIVPLQLAEDRDAKIEDGERAYRTVTQYSMGPIEDIGLLKMDFLGLRNLDVLESAVDIIARSRGERVDLDALPLDDPKTYAMMARGDSIGVFQFESEGMRDALRKVRPTEFEDLVALVALYRPGPMRFIPDYAKGKRDPGSVRLIDERLQPVTGRTYGIAIFQEQLMEIAQQIAGFSGPASDDLRKAIGKKKRGLMASMKQEFLDGCARTDTSSRVAGELWSLMEAAADYSFNKSHAACYALIAYRTAYLKANYPAEYMAAVISSVMQTKDKVPFFVARCAEMGINVLPPDVNASEHDFVVVEDDIRFGLDAVKNVGYSAVERILAARKEAGPFSSIWDFCNRVGGGALNKRAVESLIKCGAFDSLGHTRRGMLQGLVPGSDKTTVLEAAIKLGQKKKDEALSGQGSLLGGAGTGGAVEHYPPISTQEYEKAELLRLEKEAVGLFISSHPLSDIKDALARRVDCSLAALDDKADGSWMTVGGLISKIRRIRTKSGEPMAFATLDDMEGTVEMLVFNSSLAATDSDLRVDQVVIVRGRVDHKERGETKLVTQEVELFEPADDEIRTAGDGPSVGSGGRRGGDGGDNGSSGGGNRGGSGRDVSAVRLSASLEGLAPGAIEHLKELFGNFPGEAEVMLELRSASGSRVLRFGERYKVTPSAALFAELGSLLGAGVSMLTLTCPTGKQSKLRVPVSAGSAGRFATS